MDKHTKHRSNHVRLFMFQRFDLFFTNMLFFCWPAKCVMCCMFLSWMKHEIIISVSYKGFYEAENKQTLGLWMDQWLQERSVCDWRAFVGFKAKISKKLFTNQILQLRSLKCLLSFESDADSLNWFNPKKIIKSHHRLLQSVQNESNVTVHSRQDSSV